MNPEALVIEDDTAQSQIFCKAVEQAGYRYRCFSDGLEALEYLKEHQPALVVLDLHLPGMSGEDIAREIRTLPHLTGTRVILATADPRLADLLQDVSDLVLLKPVSYTQLRDLAARLRKQA